MWPETHFALGIPYTVYDVMRGLAVGASLLLCIFLNKRQGIPVKKTLLIAAVCVPVSIAAARLLNAVEYGAGWRNLNAEFLRNSGSSIYGALLACVATVFAMTRLLGIPAGRFLDAAAPAIAVGEGVSRVGCFAAGCCYGKSWNGPWAVIFPANSFTAIDQRYRGILDSSTSHSLAVHPVQLYGVLLMVLFTAFLIRQILQPHRDGVVFFWLLIGYGAYRLVIILFREEVLRSTVLFSIMFIVAGVLGLSWSKRPTAPA